MISEKVRLPTQEKGNLKDIASDSDIPSLVASCSSDGDRKASAVDPRM